MDFELNLEDLNRNKEDIKEDIISIESVCNCLENSLKGSIRDVIDDLNKCWGYNINIYKMIK